MYSDSGLSIVPWELLSYLFVPWERRKFKNTYQAEVFGVPKRNAAGHVF